MIGINISINLNLINFQPVFNLNNILIISLIQVSKSNHCILNPISMFSI